MRKSSFPARARRTLAALWKPMWAKILVFTLAFLIILRLILPWVATYGANWYLENKVPGYYGHVRTISIGLYRGSYQLEDGVFNKVDKAGKQTRFISAKLIDLSVEWKSLLHGRLVGKVKVEDPEVRFTKNKIEPKDAVRDMPTYRRIVDIGMPLDINRLEIVKGRLRYKDLGSNPRVDISMKNIHALALNLKNTIDPGTLLPSTLSVTADMYGGDIDVKTKLNPLKDNVTFDLKAELKNLDLTKLNDFFKAYAGFTIDKGKFSVYTEAAALDGNYKGYLKPLIKDLKVLGPSNKNENPITKLWEVIVGAVAGIFTNPQKETLATKIPFQGTVSSSDVNIVYAIFQVIRNAFIEALTPSLDHEINIGSVMKKESDKPSNQLKEKVEGKKQTVPKEKK